MRRNDSALVCAQECNAPFPQKVHTAGYIHRGVDADSARALSGRLSALSSVSHSKSVLYGALYGRAGRLTAQNGGFRPGQTGAIRGLYHPDFQAPCFAGACTRH